MGDTEQHSVDYLSHRRLHLARAKLKASSRTSALLSGFAMVAFVEADLSDNEGGNKGLIMAFNIITTLVVVIHLLALMISTCILPHLEVSNNIDGKDSPHKNMNVFIQLAWLCSTGLGIFLFVVQMSILAWAQFTRNNLFPTYVASTAIIVPCIGLIVFAVFAVIFYQRLIAHKSRLQDKNLEELDNIASKLELKHEVV